MWVKQLLLCGELNETVCARERERECVVVQAGKMSATPYVEKREREPLVLFFGLESFLVSLHSPIREETHSRAAGLAIQQQSNQPCFGLSFAAGSVDVSPTFAHCLRPTCRRRIFDGETSFSRRLYRLRDGRNSGSIGHRLGRLGGGENGADYARMRCAQNGLVVLVRIVDNGRSRRS